MAEFGEGLGGKEIKWVVPGVMVGSMMMMHAGSFIRVSFFLFLSLSPQNPVGTPAPTKKNLKHSLSLSLKE